MGLHRRKSAAAIDTVADIVPDQLAQTLLGTGVE